MPAINKNDLIEAIANMTVLEISELVKEMEEKFGVSAAAAVAAAPAAAAADAPAAEAEQTEFTVHLTSFGDKKISVIQAIRSITKLGLKEAKELVEKAPADVAEGLSKEDAEAAKAQLEKAGAKAELK